MPTSTGSELKKFPVILTQSVHPHLDRVLTSLMSEELFFGLEAESMIHGFQLLHRFKGGVLVVSIPSSKEQVAFHKSLNVLLKFIPQKNLKIIIFSGRNEVLESRALAQFQFIKPYVTPKNIERVIEVVKREYKSLVLGDSWLSARNHKPPSFIKKAPVYFYSTTGEHVTDPILECFNDDVVSYVYPLDLRWRIRGHFQAAETKKNELIFEVESERAYNKLIGHFQGSEYLISSSSTSKGRVCSFLEVLREGNKKFIFRRPKMTHIIQRRVSFRRKAPLTENGFVRVFDHAHKSTRLFSIFDYGPGGVGFLVDNPSVASFPVGRALQDVTLYIAGKEYRASESEVRHLSKSDAYAKLHIVGLNFVKMSRAHKMELEVALFARSI